MPWLGPPEHGRRPPRPPRRCSVLTAQHLSIPSPGDVDRRPAQTGRVADLVPRILPPYNHLGDARVCFPLGFSVCSASLPLSLVSLGFMLLLRLVPFSLSS